eukprot:TRINITY_DN2905_c0_g1_i2.p1 TRINITY_DN2905_c0_g1~~TRINITY_DN2905_c0_g1_i2.p1  ORF type:complete len:167 (-),score=28.93 TRINITY_DN2905_c0_g1_i2:68-568(-)
MFLDLHCPFSKKAYDRMKEVIAHYGEERVQFTMINWIQPWHPQATWLHQASIAAGLCEERAFWRVTDFFYAHQEEYRDEPMADVSRNQFFGKLKSIAQELSVDAEQFEKQFNGADVIQHIKWQQKYGRQNGIHASPTVMINGLVAGQVSSSWTLDQWKELLDPLVA